MLDERSDVHEEHARPGYWISFLAVTVFGIFLHGAARCPVWVSVRCKQAETLPMSEACCVVWNGEGIVPKEPEKKP